MPATFQLPELPENPALDAKAKSLVAGLETLRPLMVAYSGGVDSSCLLAVAHKVLGSDLLGVIADSPSLPRSAFHAAMAQAESLGIPVEILKTGEFEDERYAANPPNRCYFCKAELFSRMESLARERGFTAIAYGENADDVAGQRPGSVAAGEFSVVAPLRSAGFGKADVRALARAMGLSSSDLPAQPCLSSRIPHGMTVTHENVALIERGETALHELGFSIVRVRLQSMDPPTAMVQVAPSELQKMSHVGQELYKVLRVAGFEKVLIDPDGYRGAGLL